MTSNRKESAYRVRVDAAEMARSRPHAVQLANGDEQRFAAENYAMSFTKGLEHCEKTGLVKNPLHFEAFRRAIDEGYADPFTLNVPVPSVCPDGSATDRRQWEAPTTGVTYDLQGPDAQSVTMPPAPPLGSAELAYEMAEVYELALLRDQPLTALRSNQGDAKLTDAVNRLNALAYRPADGKGRPRKTNDAGDVIDQTVFRGSSPGVEIGPYLSQFLLIGTTDQGGVSQVRDGLITYGALQISQKVPVAKAVDHMTDFTKWRVVQDGWNVQGNAALFDTTVPRRFITTPRDMASYVHYDALYEAYLNACLILLIMGTPYDPSFANLSGQGRLHAKTQPGGDGTLKRQAGGFALYGGPHILTLVTEVATRALKAVRFQKFNNHLRLRPEALAARIEKAKEIKAHFPCVGDMFVDLATQIHETVDAIRAGNNGSALLPMAFQEGSPMHPSYGAGHATVAGACVTILKAYFDTSTVFLRRKPTDPKKGPIEVFDHFDKSKGDVSLAYVSNADGSALVEETDGPCLTLEGELNKLAANISIARNMAGVHYFSDYYDSLRLGEEIAIGLLEEQALCYPTDPFVLSVPTFDGGVRRIGRR